MNRDDDPSSAVDSVEDDCSASQQKYETQDSGISLNGDSTSKLDDRVINADAKMDAECTGSSAVTFDLRERDSQVEKYSLFPDGGHGDVIDPNVEQRANYSDTINHSGVTGDSASGLASNDEESSGNDMEGIDEDLVLKSESDDTDESDTELYSAVPLRDTWCPVLSLRDREIGSSSWTGRNCTFRRDVMGSLYMVERLELMYKLTFHDGCVNCLNFNSSGTRLLTGSDDTNVVLWDWAENFPLLSFDSGHRANVFQAKFMPLEGDCHIVTCARDGQVRLAELSVTGSCKSTKKLATHRGAAHRLTLEADSPHQFLSCGEDGLVYQIDLRDPKPTKLLYCRNSGENGSKVPLYSIHSNPGNPLEFVVSGRDQFCRIFDKRTLGDAQNSSSPMKTFCPDHLKTVDSVKANVTCAMYNYNGSELLSSYNDDDIFSFDTSHSDGADAIHTYRGHRNNATVKGVSWFGAKSEFIVSGSDCGYIYIWEKNSESIVQFLPGDESGVVNCLEPHPTCPILATSGLDHDAKIWVPSCENPKLNAKLLRKTIKHNKVERDRDRNESHELIDNHLLYFLYRYRRDRRRNRTREAGGNAESSGSSSDDSDSDMEAYDSADGQPFMQCRPS